MENRSIIISEHLKEDTGSFNEQNLHTCELHLNLWKSSTRPKFKSLITEYKLDIGIKIFKYGKELDKLYFYFPFKINSIEDLGKRIGEKGSELISTIFNDTYTATDENDSLFKYQLKENNSEAFYLTELGKGDWKILDKDNWRYSGSLLEIALSEAVADKVGNNALYIRFRLSLSKQDALEFIRSEENLSNDVIQAVFSKVELYDIRINDRRETDSKVLQDIEDNKHSTLLKFNKVHFFFMTDIHDKVSNGNFERMDSRILEADKWNSYIENFTTNTEIAYHWKKKADKDFGTVKTVDSDDGWGGTMDINDEDDDW